jgi:hypothetical protein
MGLSADLITEIENELEPLQKVDYKRPGVATQKFIDQYGNIITRMQIDLERLIEAGFKNGDAVKYMGLHEMLIILYGERHGSVATESEENKYVKKQMELALEDKKRLMIVARHIYDVHKDSTVKKVIGPGSSGTGVIAVLTKILELVSLIRANSETALQIRPGGILVDDHYCTMVTVRALELLKLRGYIVVRGVPRNVKVDRLNRIITLCCDAKTHIKKFAKAAFLNEFDYYKDCYCSITRRPSRRKKKNELAENTEQSVESAIPEL